MEQTNKAKALELAGKLVVYYQNRVADTLSEYYDGVLTKEQMRVYVCEDAELAQKMRNIFFGTLGGEELPRFGFEPHAEHQVAMAELELYELLKNLG